MPEITGHKGQSLYSAVEKAFSKAWKEKSKFERQRIGGYHKFKKSEEGQRIRAQATRAHAREHGPFANPGPNTRARLDDSTQPSQPNTEPEPGPSGVAPNRSDDGDSIDIQPLSGSSGSINIDQYLADYPDSIDFSPGMADIQNNLPSAPTASQVASSSGASVMDTDTPFEGRAGGAGAVAGTGLAAGIMATIVPNPRLKSGHLTFHKVWYKYTYGLANSLIETANARVVRYSTPYAYYPVDWLPYYMSPAEYQSLPFDCRVVSVNVEITPIGTRTAFDHGTTLTGTATTEYVPIVKTVVGLNTQLYIENRSVTLKSTEPMLVEGLFRY